MILAFEGKQSCFTKLYLFSNFSLLSLSLLLRKPLNHFFYPSGDLGKELKNLITMMDQEEEALQRTVSQNFQKKVYLTCWVYNRYRISPSSFWSSSKYFYEGLMNTCTTSDILRKLQNRLGDFRCLLFAHHVKNRNIDFTI